MGEGYSDFDHSGCRMGLLNILLEYNALQIIRHRFPFKKSNIVYKVHLIRKKKNFFSDHF